MNGFTKTVLMVIIAYCVGILSHIGYQQLFRPPLENSSYIDEVHDNQPQLVSAIESDISVKVDNQLTSDIEQELASVKVELKQLKAAEQKEENAKAKKKLQAAVRQKQHAEFSKLFNSPEYSKKRALDGLAAIKNELKGALDLTHEQSKVLNALLKDKFETDLEISERFSSNGKKLSKEEVTALRTEMIEQREANQRYFEEELSYELNDEQINNYLVYEQEKVKKQHSRSMDIREASVLSHFSDLEDYQKTEIKSYIQGIQANLDDVTIGSYGRTFGLRITVDSTEYKQALSQYLEQVLTEEQFRHYKEQTKKK